MSSSSPPPPVTTITTTTNNTIAVEVAGATDATTATVATTTANTDIDDWESLLSDSLVVVTTTTTTPTKQPHTNNNSSSHYNSNSPWEDASYALLLQTATDTNGVTTNNRPQSLSSPQSPQSQSQSQRFHLGRFGTTRNSNTTTTTNNNDNHQWAYDNEQEGRGHNNNNNNNNSWWSPLQSRTASQSPLFIIPICLQRLILQYTTCYMDIVIALVLVMYGIAVLYHNYYSIVRRPQSRNITTTTTSTSITATTIGGMMNDADDADEDLQRMSHANYVLSSIVMCIVWCIVIGILIRSIACSMLLQSSSTSSSSSTLSPPSSWSNKTTTTTSITSRIITTTTGSSRHSNTTTIFVTYGICRRITLVFIMLYIVCCISILIGWNIAHASFVRHFLLVLDDTPSSSSLNSYYNIHTYWLVPRNMITYLQRHHHSCIGYFYLLFLALCILEIVRYHLFDSYYYYHYHSPNGEHEYGNSIRAQQLQRHWADDSSNNNHLLRESLLPWNYNNSTTDVLLQDNIDRNITTTSWRKTTLSTTNRWQWWKTQSDTFDGPNNHNTNMTTERRQPPHAIHPDQLQEIQEEWNYYKDMNGPLWWSFEEEQ